MMTVKGMHNAALEGEELPLTVAKGEDWPFIVGNSTHPKMQRDSNRMRPFVALLKACAKQKDLHRGSRIHADILRAGLLEENVYLGSSLVNMYVKCGSLAKAQEVFDKLPVRNVVSWNALLAGFAQHGQDEQALKLFEQMQLESISPDAVSYICILKTCGSLRAIEKGKQIHDEIVQDGLLKKDIILGTTLVDMYAKCGFLAKAQEVFDDLPVHNVVSWNALMAAYAQHGHGQQTLKCLDWMQLEELCPDAVTYICILKACGSIGAAEKGKEIHAKIVREGILMQDIFVGNALIDMYAKVGLLAQAQEVFDELPAHNAASWNALMAGYIQHGYDEKALKWFEQMQLEGPSPDSVTYSCILKLCGNMRAAEKGKEIHAIIINNGLLKKDLVVGTALVDMYVKCDLVSKAEEVFDELMVRDVVLWSALIGGYVLNGYSEQALRCFEHMQHEGLSPNVVTYIWILKACSSTGAIDKGKEIHADIVKRGLLKENTVVGNVLVDMYAKWGLVEKAEEVFGSLPVQDVVSWNALMTGFSLLGKAEHVFNLYDNMLGQGIRPDLTTFTIVLNACRHAGLLEQGQVYFDTMTTCYGIIPILEHYTCMADLFLRAGHLEKAVAVIKEMPLSADLTVWLTILGACQKWGNLKLGKLAFEHAVRLCNTEDAAYVCMSNIYAADGR